MTDVKKGKWIRKSSIVLLDHPRLKVLEDEVSLPDGKQIKYLRFGKMSDSVTVIAQNEDGRILLLSEYSYPPGRWLLEFPGGSINGLEKPVDAANRELMEEANLKANKLQLLGKYFINNRRSDALMYVFLATMVEGAFLEKDVEEDFNIYWHGIVEIDEKIISGGITNCHVLAPWSMFKLVTGRK